MRQERRRFSTNARIYFTTVPILPSVKGRVIEVPVEDNTNRHLEAGAVLFKIDPKPYEYAVAEKRAGLADAEASVAQLKALVDQASATVEKAKAQLQLAQENYDRQATLFQKNVVAQATLDTATRNLDASKQTVAEAVAAEDRARQAYGATVDGEHSVIVRLRNELADAQYGPDRCSSPYGRLCHPAGTAAGRLCGPGALPSGHGFRQRQPNGPGFGSGVPAERPAARSCRR
jgi:multidrug resistance efflux pump